LLLDPVSRRFSLFDLMKVQDACADIPGRNAELHDYRGLKRAKSMRARVQSDLINVF
jgi:hypothetical protein